MKLKSSPLLALCHLYLASYERHVAYALPPFAGPISYESRYRHRSSMPISAFISYRFLEILTVSRQKRGVPLLLLAR